MGAARCVDKVLAAEAVGTFFLPGEASKRGVSGGRFFS